jgi:hypothetical protein
MDSEVRSEEQQPAWVKSSFSHPWGGNCAEFTTAPESDDVLMRDSKDPDGPRLRFTRPEIKALLDGAAAGEFRQFT